MALRLCVFAFIDVRPDPRPKTRDWVGCLDEKPHSEIAQGDTENDQTEVVPDSNPSAKITLPTVTDTVVSED